MVRLYKHLFLFICCTQSLTIVAIERILLFDADIHIRKDATVLVKEELFIECEHDQILHGIVRELPTIYQDNFGLQVMIDFNIKEILLDGKPTFYKTEQQKNGVAIYIGNERAYLTIGQHLFTIVYEINRQLGFFKNHDELYWNVTGNGWQLPIDKVKARVHVPEGVDITTIQHEAYTGFYGQTGHYVEEFVARDGSVHFTTTRSFRPKEGLTIVIGWPKGYVTYPTWLQYLLWFSKDNSALLIFLLGLFFLLMRMYYVYNTKKRMQQTKAIIPLFYPPKDMTPGMVSYFINHGAGSDTKSLSAEFVAMAVHGWLHIRYISGTFYGGTYQLLKNKPPTNPDSMYRSLYNTLFKKNKMIELTKTYRAFMQACAIIVKRHYKHLNQLFDTNVDALVQSIIVAVTSYLGMFYLSPYINNMTMICILTYTALLCIFYYFFFDIYTVQGYELWRDIEGFKLFLSTTEQERLAIIGTPPTKTPELYETYLPYAIALGVEKQWNKQFVPVFEQLKHIGHPYHPIWLIGPHDYPRTSDLISGISSGMHTAISSAITPPAFTPGRSSGFGGRSGSGGGFSGGGGGGGGGRGW